MTNEVGTRTCLGCGSEVSRDAARCPHCGRTLKGTGGWLFLAFSLLMGAWFVYALASGGQGRLPLSPTTSFSAGYPVIAVAWLVVAIIYWRRRRKQQQASRPQPPSSAVE